jgi:aspartate/methionine/tyrosine aminotransferase
MSEVSMKDLNNTVTTFKESIFSTITQLANSKQAINLAQGFPDFDGPEWILNLAKNALYQGKNQYAPSLGILSLRQAISNNYNKYYKLSYDPQSEIVVTNGATEAIYSTVAAIINPGDEVVVFEPFYDSYSAALQIAGAKIVPVTLHLPDFSFKAEELIAKLNAKTKLVIINNPHNPTGRVFTKEELSLISALAQKYDFYILSDEVYEFLTYDIEHIPTATIAGLKERTITISSIGKTLSLTGWKIGWAAGPAHLIKAIHNVRQFISFSVAHPLQVAIAETLNNLDDYLTEFRRDYTRKKDILVKGLIEAGFEIIPPKGTYFVIAKTSQNKNDVEFCKELILNNKVATIPTSAFYVDSKEGEGLVRFCFAKKDETLLAAIDNLKGTRS